MFLTYYNIITETPNDIKCFKCTKNSHKFKNDVDIAVTKCYYHSCVIQNCMRYAEVSELADEQD